MLSQRYALIHQRLLRHEFFRPTDLSRCSARLKIIPIESLLGSAQDQSVLLLGLLLQIEEGQWYLEDPSGQVPISFQCLSQVDDFFATEHCILVVEGRLDDGTFYVEHVGNPVLEQRETSLSAIRQQLSHPAYTTRSAPGSDASSSSFVFVDAHLDQPRTVQHLEALLARYEKFPPTELPVFVLMGNFSSEKENPAPMEELASLILTFSNLKRHGRFVLVPGLHDTPGYTLPVANTLSRSGGFGRIANVEWATNPCRIRNRHTGREVVVFRYDLLHLLQRQQLLLKHQGSQPEADAVPASQNGDNDDDDMMDGDGPTRRVPVESHVRLVKTLLGQGHMIPVSGVPVAWNYDHSLRLYPLPDVLVLGGDGSGSGRYHEVYEGCHVLHPGSLVDGSFAAYSEAHVDEDDDDDDEDATGPRVEFGQLGVET
jgi:DNA polymerase epsilon subunit 2